MNDWGHKLRKNFRDQIEVFRRELEIARASNDNQDVGSFLEVKNKLGSLIAQEETYWR